PPPPNPQILVNNENVVSRRGSEHDVHSALSSRRPSAIIAALRRPSQAIALSAAQAIMHQRRYILGYQSSNYVLDYLMGKAKAQLEIRKVSIHWKWKLEEKNRKLGDDSLTIILSALYAKLLVVLGMAFPITEIISKEVQPFFYQGYYLYLYLGSISFVAYLYASLIREKAVVDIINSYNKEKSDLIKKPPKPVEKFGSFYLRLGAIAFGIGSMVYSGLEFGKYFELKNNPDCHSNILQAITPATRMVLTLVQVQFIFLNSKVGNPGFDLMETPECRPIPNLQVRLSSRVRSGDMSLNCFVLDLFLFYDIEFNRHDVIARFGLMHMIATNLCEWLYVLVEETKHEIIHLEEEHNATMSMIHKKYCQEGYIMGSLITNASPFLFPCTIEYSLICAVILFEMWKKVKRTASEGNGKIRHVSKHTAGAQKEQKVTTHIHFNPFGGRVIASNHHFTVDCSNAHRGLFAGIMVIVLTIISLIMFFVLANSSQNTEARHKMAEFEVNLVELLLYIITTLAVLFAMLQMRKLKYDRKIDHHGPSGIGLDNTLLVVAQTGMFIYCMFSIIGCYFTLESESPIGLVADIFSFVQTCLQTMFVLDGWFRRCRTIEQTKNKPGRELITFLIVANMALWTINTLEKNRAEFRPTHLKFFGDWAWTIITHISMPLAIFYRFHSTICLFEIWKSAYKIKTQLKHPFFPIL
ncbi:hypothetical protein NQ317_012508, partial [Molorchus minor]